MKKFLNKKNIIILISLLSIILLSFVVWYLINYTVLFKSNEEIENDIGDIRNNAENKLSKIDDLDKYKYSDLNSVGIEDSLYKDKVGISNGTLYIKEGAENKLKDVTKGTSIGQEATAKSENGLLIVESQEKTKATDCKVINAQSDIISIEVFHGDNMCEQSYIVGSIKDDNIIKQNKDDLLFTRVIPNKQYTIANIFNAGENKIYLFDKNKNYINTISDNTFITPENAYYAKFTTELKECNEVETQYSLVFGDKTASDFSVLKSEVAIDTHNVDADNIYIPLESNKNILIIDGGDIEVKYVKPID